MILLSHPNLKLHLIFDSLWWSTPLFISEQDVESKSCMGTWCFFIYHLTKIILIMLHYLERCYQKCHIMCVIILLLIETNIKRSHGKKNIVLTFSFLAFSGYASRASSCVLNWSSLSIKPLWMIYEIVSLSICTEKVNLIML